MDLAMVLISLHYATIFNGLMSQKGEAGFTPSKAAAVEMHIGATILCFGTLILYWGFYGLILFILDFFISLVLVKTKKINFFLSYYLKCDVFVPILWITCGIIKFFL